MKAVAIAKSYLRKRRNCAERGKQRRMFPLRVTKKELESKKQYYINRADALVEKIKAFQPDDFQHGEKTLFEGYRILSYNGDQMGKVLKKDGRIFRGIYAESVDWFKKLWNIGLIQTLAEEGIFPETAVTDFQTEEFPIILEHKVIEISTAKMWNPEMVRDACITISFVDSVCRRFGYKLIDGHLNNISFSNGKPIFTDIGSIVEDKGQYTAYESSLVFAGGYKLIASALGNSIIDRIQFFDENNNAIWPAPFCYDESTYECRHLLKKFKKWHRLHSSLTANNIIFRLFELGQVRPEYFDLIFKDAPLKEQTVGECADILSAVLKQSVQSVTVVGGPVSLGQAIYDKSGIRVVVLDHSVDASRYSYRNSENISCYCYNYLYGGDIETLNCIRSELVVAEKVTENLISYQNWKLESVFNGLSKLTSRYAVVLFDVGRKASRCIDSAVDDVRLFEKKFSEFFNIIETAHNGDNYIFVGELREA